MALWLLGLSPDRAACVRTLAGDIVLCSYSRRFTLTVPLSIQVYKWLLANAMGNQMLWVMLWVIRQSTRIPSRGEWKYSWSLHAA